jgi:hypothetical protein
LPGCAAGSPLPGRAAGSPLPGRAAGSPLPRPGPRGALVLPEGADPAGAWGQAILAAGQGRRTARVAGHCRRLGRRRGRSDSDHSGPDRAGSVRTGRRCALTTDFAAWWAGPSGMRRVLPRGGRAETPAAAERGPADSLRPATSPTGARSALVTAQATAGIRATAEAGDRRSRPVIATGRAMMRPGHSRTCGREARGRGRG